MKQLTDSKLRQLIREEARRLQEQRDFMGEREMNSYLSGKGVVGYRNMGRKKLVLFFQGGTTFKFDAKGYSVENARVRTAEDAGEFAQGKKIAGVKIKETGGGIIDVMVKFGTGEVLVAEEVESASKPNYALDLEEHFNSLGSYSDFEMEFNVEARRDDDHGRLVGTLEGTDITIRRLRRTQKGKRGYKGVVEVGGETFEVEGPTPDEFAKRVGKRSEEHVGGFFSNLF